MATMGSNGCCHVDDVCDECFERAFRLRQWNTESLQRDFTVLGFAAPYVIVRRKLDDKLGSLTFTHSPRVYFNWQED